ncbi:MAG: NAD(+) kinase [Bacteroidetes bacterium]|jgi:NAD+ kinase|nr:NAD(+) kinase [Bacteroidota bacterium]
MLRSVAIFSKDTNARTKDSVQKLIDEFSARGIVVQLFQRSGEMNHPYTGSSLVFIKDIKSILSHLPDMIFSVGGDGTFLETVLRVKETGVPVAGVNTGRMGFLANIPNEDLDQSVDLLCKGSYEIVERSMLEIQRPAKIFGGDAASALNEITIQKASMSMITIHVYVNDEFLNTYWADGLIVSTATGSTAYNLSVGGPILSPEDESIIISPISPHNLTIRPIVLSGESRLRMMLEARADEFLATCDFRYRKLPLGEEIHIVRSDIRLKTVMLKGRGFYSTLRNRLMWGADKRN